MPGQSMWEGKGVEGKGREERGTCGKEDTCEKELGAEN